MKGETKVKKISTEQELFLKIKELQFANDVLSEKLEEASEMAWELVQAQQQRAREKPE